MEAIELRASLRQTPTRSNSRLRLQALVGGDVVGWNVTFALLVGLVIFQSGQPPVSGRVVDDLEYVAPLETQVFVGSGIVVVEGYESL